MGASATVRCKRCDAQFAPTGAERVCRACADPQDLLPTAYNTERDTIARRLVESAIPPTPFVEVASEPVPSALRYADEG